MSEASSLVPLAAQSLGLPQHMLRELDPNSLIELLERNASATAAEDPLDGRPIADRYGLPTAHEIG